MAIEYPRLYPVIPPTSPPTEYAYNQPSAVAFEDEDYIIAYYDQHPPVLTENPAMMPDAPATPAEIKAAKKALAQAAIDQKALDAQIMKEAKAYAYAQEQAIKAANKAYKAELKAQKEAEKAAAKAAKEAEKAAKKARAIAGLEVYIPEWSDVIKLGPDLKPTAEQTAEYYDAIRAKRRPNLDQAVIDAINNKRRRLRAMRDSQVPEGFQKLGQLLTTLDNINDAMLTAAWITRVGALIPSPASPFLAALSLGLTTGAVVMDGLSFLAPLALPQAVAKRMTARLGQKIGSKALKKLLRIPGPLGKILPSWAEFVQIAQTSADTVGYGLSIGPIYGLVQEAFFRGIVNPVDALVGKPYAGLSNWALSGVRWVAEAFALGSTFAPMDHLYDLVVLHACLSRLCSPTVCAAFPHLIAEALHQWEWTEPLTDEADRLILRAEGGDPDIEPHFLYPGAEDILFVDESMTAFQPLIAHNLTDWWPGLEDPFLICFAALLLNECADMFMKLLGGWNNPIQTIPDPAAEALLQIVHYGLIPPQTSSPHEVRGYGQSVAHLRLVRGEPLMFLEILRIYLDYGFEWPPPQRL